MLPFSEDGFSKEIVNRWWFPFSHDTEIVVKFYGYVEVENWCYSLGFIWVFLCSVCLYVWLVCVVCYFEFTLSTFFELFQEGKNVPFWNTWKLGRIWRKQYKVVYNSSFWLSAFQKARWKSYIYKQSTQVFVTGYSRGTINILWKLVLDQYSLSVLKLTFPNFPPL